jgi:hypothetical protein
LKLAHIKSPRPSQQVLNMTLHFLAPSKQLACLLYNVECLFVDNVSLQEVDVLFNERVELGSCCQVTDKGKDCVFWVSTLKIWA